MNRAQWAMIKKDVGETTGSAQTFVPLLVVPLMMMVLLPLALVIGAQFGESALGGMNGFDQLLKHFGDRLAGDTAGQTIINVGVNVFFPSLFLLIPVMCSSIMGASSFVGEKEHRTLESLLYTPLSLRQMFVAKVVGTCLLSLAITYASMIAFGLVIDIGGWFQFGRLIFPNWKWVILALWVTPGVTVLGVTVMVFVSSKAETFQDAQQMSVFVVLPILLLILGQASGLFLLEEWMLLVIGLVVVILDVVLLRNAAVRYRPETMI